MRRLSVLVVTLGVLTLGGSPAQGGIPPVASLSTGSPQASWTGVAPTRWPLEGVLPEPTCIPEDPICRVRPPGDPTLVRIDPDVGEGRAVTVSGSASLCPPPAVCPAVLEPPLHFTVTMLSPQVRRVASGSPTVTFVAEPGLYRVEVTVAAGSGVSHYRAEAQLTAAQ